MNEAQQNILKTLIYFDLFDYPLVVDEFIMWLPKTLRGKSILSLDREEIRNLKLEIREKLDELVRQNEITEKMGYYFLPGRDGIVGVRKERHIESLKKIKRAQKMARFLSLLPFIKMVAVCNVLGYLNAKKEDDIDLFIITSSNRIWTARWWSAGIAKLLDLRPRPGNISDKFCFSFFVAEDSLNLKEVALENDIYFYYWLRQLLPLYDEENYFDKFLEANSLEQE